MLELFVRFVTDNKLFQQSDRILLAVSGGVDSVVLCHLFNQAKFNFGIAHCNFKLREDASEEDARFVEKLAQQFKVPFYLESFETIAIAKERKDSIQLTARNLRYQWLEQIRSEQSFRYIATAHHLNDSIETVIYNFTKGCGIRGLHGIPLRNRYIIRPLLFAKKTDILNFSELQRLPFRVDLSNSTTKYSRNKIRHEIIPVLKALNSGFEKTAQENIERLKGSEVLFDWAIEQIKKEVLKEEKDLTKVDVRKLLQYPSPKTILYELLSPFGFSASQINQLLPFENHQTGINFYSETHVLLLDRFSLLIKTKRSRQTESYTIPKPNFQINLETEHFAFRHYNTSPVAINTNRNVAQLDLAKLIFPLTIRHWKEGDFFCPLGMNGKHQKLQDFFSNNKLSRFQKETIWILENGTKEICWIIGLRIDDRFKLTEITTNYLQIEYYKVDENE